MFDGPAQGWWSRRAITVTFLVLACAMPAAAHVAPSVDDNNRYLKLTPYADRVRFAYTVFFGEVPGAAMRPSLDTDRNRTITDAEGQAFGAKLATEVAAGLELVIDGHPTRVTWSQVAVGMGSPQVAAGTFSVDFIAYVCLPVVGGRHTLLLRDRFRIPHPGETEVKVESSADVTIEHARVGQADDPSFDYRFVGPGGPLSDDGLDLAFVASATAPIADDLVCAGASPHTGSSALVVIAIGVGLLLVVGGAIVVARKRAA